MLVRVCSVFVYTCFCVCSNVFVAARQPDVLQSTNQDAMRLGNQNASLKTGKYISVMSSTINRLYS